VLLGGEPTASGTGHFIPKGSDPFLLDRSLVWLQILKVLVNRRISYFCWEYLIHNKRQAESENENM